MSGNGIELYRERLQRLQEGLERTYESIVEDHRENMVCVGYGDFMRETPAAFLDRARERLAKRSYKVCFAGGFSGGKSTLINALLREPNLLPAGAGECTMSITIITSPPEGEGEHVRVFYWTYEDALKNLFLNERYKRLFSEHTEEVFRGFSKEKALEVIRGVVEDLANSKEDQDKRKELLEFLEALERFGGRLGTCYRDNIECVNQYLTTDDQNRGLGHLLLIEQVHIFKDNPLFVQKGIEIVDLPGTDSANVRQRELTHSYLSESDVVLLVLEPKGFKSADIDIGRELGKHNNEIRSKMFFVMNMFDRLDLDEISKAEVEKLYQAQVVEQIVKNGLDPRRVYLTSAKWVELRLKRERGRLDAEEAKVLERMDLDARTKLEALDSSINPDLLRLMRGVYTTGGVEELREDLIGYLEGEIQMDRMMEIFSDLRRVYEATRRLLEPERARVLDLLERLKSRSRQVNEYFQKALDVVYGSLEVLQDERRLEVVIQKSLEGTKERFKAGLKSFVERGLNFQRIKGRLSVPTPLNIKMEAISICKMEVPQRYVELVGEATYPKVTSKLQEILDSIRLRSFLEHFSRELGVDYAHTYEMALVHFVQTMRLFTEMRVQEETWAFQGAELKPKAYETVWNSQIERAFREDLLKLLTETFLQYTNRLSRVLWRHYKFLVSNLLRSIEELLEEIAQEVKKDPERVSLPDLLSTGVGVDGEEESKLKIVRYIHSLESLEGVYRSLCEDLGNGVN